MLETRVFFTCDRCHEDQIVNDENTLPAGWLELSYTNSSGTNYEVHLCPKCSDKFSVFLSGEPK